MTDRNMHLYDSPSSSDLCDSIIPRVMTAGHNRGMRIDGARVRELRAKKKWTQDRLAEESGLSQETISRIEKGHIKGREAATQEQLADALDTTVAYLRGDTDDPALDARPKRRVAPGAAPSDDDPLTPFEQALFAAMDHTKFLPGDFDVVRSAIRQTFHLLKDEPDLTAMAREWLTAARQLRLEGHPVDTSAIVARVSVGRGRRSIRAAVAADAELNAEADRRARAMGVEPGSGSDVADELAAMAAKQNRKRGE
jgi:transcriptional regulator with XRE-family HTH domain